MTQEILALVAERSGMVFGPNRRGEAEAGIARAMKHAGVDDLAAYLTLVRDDGSALDGLVDELTVGETHFMRDPAQMALIRIAVLSALKDRRQAGGPPARVWSAGCATGEEAYSLAILLEEEGLDQGAFVLGTDLSAAALDKARAGSYPEKSVRGASGPFLEELSGPGRTIVTATRTGAERFATLFGGYFIDALMSDTADADKNRRVSVLEAFDAAKIGVARAYEQEGIMLTEHPLLDDSGDKKGATDPKADGKNGRVASILALGTVQGADTAPADPKMRALYEERRDLERRVEGLKLMKSGMEPARYASELEKLLTELALKSQQIKDLEGKK